MTSTATVTLLQGWDDGEFAPSHLIVCNSTWGACDGGHTAVAEVRECYRRSRIPAAWPCTWLLPSYNEDGPCTVECGAPTLETKHGYQCENGHEHIDMQYMAEQGLAYASDEVEAARLVKAGVHPLQMDGREFGPLPVS
jgi:hypothetical protein